MQASQHTPTGNAIQAPSPEMGMANPVDKAVSYSDYREPLDSDDQEPKQASNPQKCLAPASLNNANDNPSRIVANTRHSGARLLSALGCAVTARLMHSAGASFAAAC